jgi:hypothetical protein
MSTSAIYFLFVLIAGQGDSASFSTLANYPDRASCTTAATAIGTALKDGAEAAHVFCVSSDDVKGLAGAAKQ